jgi:hypothetical protein
MNPLDTYPKKLSEIRSSGAWNYRDQITFHKNFLILHLMQDNLTISYFSAYNRFGY